MMRLKLDENLDTRLAEWLVSIGHDASTVSGERLSGASDEEIFAVVIREERCLITLDLDFADPFRFPPSNTAGIAVLRVPVPSMALIRLLLEQAMGQVATETPAEEIWIVEPGRVRIWESWDV